MSDLLYQMLWRRVTKDCINRFSRFILKMANISITRRVQIPNSTDLDSGRRPKLKSVEFGICTFLVTEICDLTLEQFSRSCCSLS